LIREEKKEQDNVDQGQIALLSLLLLSLAFLCMMQLNTNRQGVFFYNITIPSILINMFSSSSSSFLLLRKVI
jgi:hypothetical protein